MALEHQEKIKCKDCSCEFDITVYESVNGAFDVQAEEKLLKGELFTHICPNCNNVISLSYPMLYHNMDHRFMIHICPAEDDVQECIDNIKSAQKQIDKQFPEKRMEKPYTFRIVPDENALREKAAIFSHGLDDRIIELLKLFFNSTFRMQNPASAAIVDMLFFVGKNGEYAFQIFLEDGTYLVSDIPKHFYTLFKEKYTSACDLISHGNYVVDGSFAVAVMNVK